MAKHMGFFFKFQGENAPFKPFTAVINARNTPGGKYGYFDVIMVLHIISYKIITTVGIYTKFFPACLSHLVQCLK